MTYCVVKQGVYIQGVYGPCATELKARELAQALAAADSDNYHEWDVCPLSLDGIGEPTATYRNWYLSKAGPYWKRAGAVEEYAIAEDKNRK